MRHLYSSRSIEAAVNGIGSSITNDYAIIGKELVLVCVMKGGMVFMSDLMRKIYVPFVVDYYSGRDIYTPSSDHSGKDILIVDGVCDTGDQLLNVASKYNSAKTIKTCVLVDKVDCRKFPIQINYKGFTMEGKDFIVGYGMDDNQYRRGLPYIGVKEKNVKRKTR